ncbi:SRPBCC family protein [Pseudomonas sp. MAP12]|uniref:SRPBCC family protein n=2 Tax=Geopseudomonas aromaticivorans TaxID=2849492 RepID=A0ABS6N118_9GAMM|nr:SRPBCC family protein [Pseudomonas aromaticivorans]
MATMIQPARILTIGIDQPLSQVAAFLAEPRNFPRWASGLADGLEPAADSPLLPLAGSEWLADTPHGRLRIRFSPANLFGVADHWVHLEDDRIVYVPLRVVANGDGCTVSLTLFRRPEIDEEHFAADCDWVRRDLLELRRVLGG